jgi:hypothetical protein
MALMDGITAGGVTAGGIPRRMVDGAARRKVYRMTVDAYNSRVSYGSSVWQLDILAWDPEGARLAFSRWARTGLVSPVGTGTAGRCRHAQPCFLSHGERMHYPEWSVRSMVQRRTATLRKPFVWLAKGPVTVVGAAGWRRPTLVNGSTADNPVQAWGLGAWK